MPTVPQCVILNYELSGDWRAEAQREWRRSIQLFIRERAYRGRGFTTIAAQEFKRRSFCCPSVFLGMLGIYARNNFPGDVRNCLATGDCSRDVNLNRVHEGNMMHDHANGTAVGARYGRVPFCV
jgi:hypothetical protein